MPIFNINGTTIDLPLTIAQAQATAKQITKEYGAKEDYDYFCLDRADRADFARYVGDLRDPALTLERRLDTATLLETLLSQAQRINAEHLR